MSLLPSDAELFEFESDGWLERLRRLERAEPLGSLGPYELVAEAGRGGQGVVYRALQPVTRREIAVKRLLAGKLATPESLRRFEREIAAASALNHPGIVAVYGVDFVGGAPLLAMEWVEGVPVTEWARGRPRAEVLTCFLAICDAVQHAHQHGVLHRDVKPSNVLVDAAGRPRLLDFGLARLFQTDSSITASGDFLGTPAYAAPEQLDGAELDVRADVYALGAILFELLTGRRLLEGEGMEALLRAARTLVPPRPSSLVPSIPRDLDAIVLQALARERVERYQSVDALAADLRRFVAGAPVLAQPPSGWYLVRKLVARNRLAAGLVAALVAGALTTGVAYTVMSARHAERLTAERDKAVRASVAADEARREADGERRLAEEARDDARTEADRARAEQEKAEAVISFFMQDVVAAVETASLGYQPTLLELLQSSVPKIAERFRDEPFLEGRVRGMVGGSLWTLGDLVGGERELRAAVQVLVSDPAAVPLEIANFESSLGGVLVSRGQYAEAEPVLLSAESRLVCEPEGRRMLYIVYRNLGEMYLDTARYERLEWAIARQLECATNAEELLAARSNTANLAMATGRTSEALVQLDALVAEGAATLGEHGFFVGVLLFNRGECRLRLRDFEGAEADLRRTVAIMTDVFGPEHARTAAAKGKLANILLQARKSLPEAEALARHSLESLRASSTEGLQLMLGLACVTNVLRLRGDAAGALPFQAELLALLERHHGRGAALWAQCAGDMVLPLVAAGRLDEAERLVEQLAVHPQRPSRGLSLRLRAAIQAKRGNLEQALELYDEALPLLVASPGDKEEVQPAFADFAALLREMGDDAGAAEILRQAAEVPR